MRPCSQCKLGPVCLVRGFDRAMDRMVLKGVTKDITHDIYPGGVTPTSWEEHTELVVQRVLDEDVPAGCPERPEG